MWILFWNVACSSVSPSNIGYCIENIEYWIEILPALQWVLQISGSSLAPGCQFQWTLGIFQIFEFLPIPMNTVNISKYCQFQLLLWMFQNIANSD